MGLTTRETGEKAEAWAQAFLQKNGLMIVEKNFRLAQGEIDLIAKDGKTLVFVEVRFRTSALFGLPQETVDYRKQRKLLKTAAQFLQMRKEYSDCPCRFDVVSITLLDGTPKIDWIKHAFDASYQ